MFYIAVAIFLKTDSLHSLMGSNTFELNVVYSQNIQFSAAVIFFLLKLMLPFYIDVFISYTT